MSYDFHLFQPEPDSDPFTAYTTWMERVEINPGSPIPEKELRKRAIATALMNGNLSLEVFQFGFDEIANFEGISVEEAKRRYRHYGAEWPRWRAGHSDNPI